MELETDWIDKFEQNEKNYNLFYKQSNEYIEIFSLYINSNCVLEKIKQKQYKLAEHKLNESEILSLINEHRNDENIKYKLLSLFSYNITLDPVEIIDYINNKENNYLSMHKRIENIMFNDTIKMFQDLNSIFLIFYEIPIKLNNNNNTKKVYIHPSTTNRKTHRKTHH
jgi:hypothetical protein